MNPFTIIAILSQAMTAIPKIVEAVQTIMASDAAHTIESAFAEFFNHSTAGAPNSPALAPTAQPISFQAPQG